MEEESIHYDVVVTPKNASEENKSGITIKGKDIGYIDANKRISEMFRNKGDKFLINEIELRISDAPKNKPITIEVKPKGGLTGRANLKMYDINNRGVATIHVTRVSGGDMLHVTTLARNVMMYLLDNILLGNITEETMQNFSRAKECADKSCDMCDKVFPTEHGLKLHKAKVHRSVMQFNCDKCKEAFTSRSDFERHNESVHEEKDSPDAKKIRLNDSIEKECKKESREIEIQVSEFDLEFQQNYEENEKMEVDEKEETNLEKNEDEKVKRKQRMIEKEVEKMKEEHQRKQRLKDDQERIRKRQISTEKKKRKKKARKERMRNEEKTDSIEKENEKIRNIDAKYAKMFTDVGLNIDDYKLYSVRGDGACGANATALACHNDQKLGPYVRRNINNYIVEHYEFFESHINFPHIQLVGNKEKKFKDKTEYLKFLKEDSESGWLWMDHVDFQAVSNSYQISIHILTTNVANVSEPGARWTHISPDTRLKSYCSVPAGLPDMWLRHVDEQHFELIVKNDSILVTNGSIDDYIEKVDREEEENNTELEDKNEIGPGYMGWKIGEESEVDDDRIEYKDLKIAYNVLQKKHSQLEEEVRQNKVKQTETVKDINKLRMEMKNLVAEYKECIEVLRKETYERTKAETTSKVLKEILETKDEAFSERAKEKGENLIEEMDVDEESQGVWIRQQKKRKNMSVSNKEPIRIYKCERCETICKGRKDMSEHMKSHIEIKSFECEKCESICINQNELTEHIRQTHITEKSYQCNKCEEVFSDNHKLREHVKVHTKNVVYKCEKCDISFEECADLEKHEIKHKAEIEITEVSCSKCDRCYTNMSKLRRHDWRSHRKIDCNICGEALPSRQHISEHRQAAHGMFRKLKCKFYPDCIDETECFFTHENGTENKNAQIVEIQTKYCPSGEACENQSCEYSEQNHRNTRDILCRFQTRCSRSDCRFKHEKSSFLGDCMKNLKTK